VDYVEQHESFMGPDTFAHIMPKERSLDIDHEIDFIIAETLLEKSPAMSCAQMNWRRYHQYLLTRSSLGIFYRNKFLYPRLSKRLKGVGLDIGCGIGDFIKFHKNCEGVDINPFNVEYCLNCGLMAQVYDGISLSFLEKSYDFVVMDNVLEHIPDPVKILTEVSRVLKMGGLFALGIPGAKGYSADLDHKHFYAKADLQKLLAPWGFILVEHFSSPLPFYGAGKILRQQSDYYFFKKK
jgi:SAM-dependent methyltransferase